MTNDEAIVVLVEALNDVEAIDYGSAKLTQMIQRKEAIRQAIAVMCNQQEWIPCSERMPEEYEANPIQKAQRIKKVSKRLLATIVTKFDIKPHVVEARTKDGNWYVDHVDLIKPYLGEVTAWMPLPEAYEP